MRDSTAVKDTDIVSPKQSQDIELRLRPRPLIVQTNDGPRVAQDVLQRSRLIPPGYEPAIQSCGKMSLVNCSFYANQLSKYPAKLKCEDTVRHLDKSELTPCVVEGYTINRRRSAQTQEWGYLILLKHGCMWKGGSYVLERYLHRSIQECVGEILPPGRSR
jgi:hypothetical protein